MIAAAEKMGVDLKMLTGDEQAIALLKQLNNWEWGQTL